VTDLERALSLLENTNLVLRNCGPNEPDHDTRNRLYAHCDAVDAFLASLTTQANTGVPL
jgi:hypothetical protein